MSTSSFAFTAHAVPSTPRLSPHQIEDEADAVAQMEEQELEALLALASDEGDPVMTTYMEEQARDIPSSPTRYGSDEEDYDDLFMEMVSSQGGSGTLDQFGPMQSQIHDDHMQEDVEMDMSL